jgi:hypothetical protein
VHVILVCNAYAINIGIVRCKTSGARVTLVRNPCTLNIGTTQCVIGGVRVTLACSINVLRTEYRYAI